MHSSSNGYMSYAAMHCYLTVYGKTYEMLKKKIMGIWNTFLH